MSRSSDILIGHKKTSVRKRIKKYLFLYIMALPAIAYLIINNYMPMIGLTLAFKDYSFAKGIFKSKWVGFSNFTYPFRLMFNCTPSEYRNSNADMKPENRK